MLSGRLSPVPLRIPGMCCSVEGKLESGIDQVHFFLFLVGNVQTVFLQSHQHSLESLWRRVSERLLKDPL